MKVFYYFSTFCQIEKAKLLNVLQFSSSKCAQDETRRIKTIPNIHFCFIFLLSYNTAFYHCF